jgi:hypothetical protein
VKVFKFAALFVFSQLSIAQEHLHPEDSIYGGGLVTLDYHLFVTNAFKAAYSGDVILKVITIPSFHPESALYIEKSNGTYSLILLEAETHYWGKYDRNYVATPIEKCKVSLDENLAIKVESAWLKELFKTKYPNKYVGGMDGTTYHFSTPPKRLNDDNPFGLIPDMAGVTWSPEPESRVGMLVGLSEALTQFCQKNNSAENIQNMLSKLAQ